MSITEAKRPLPAKIHKMKARKRQKLERGVKFDQAQAQKNYEPDKPVNLDDLDWKQVDVPDNLDDFGGFYGLEEIDGVDVVKDEARAKITFKIAPKIEKPAKSNKTLRNGDSEASKGKKTHASRMPAEVVDEEWAGFDDEPVQNLTEMEGEEKLGTEQNSTASKKKSSNQVRLKSQSKQGTSRKDKRGDTVSFSALEDLDEGSNTDVSAWRKLELSAEVLHALSRLGFSTPTHIQEDTIPRIRDGEDLIGKAPTGSGKTLAFGIPIVENLISGDQATKRTKQKEVSALIILPTRELAHQIHDHIRSLINYAELDDIKVATVTGGLSIQKQRRLLAQANIVVATPGRLWEVITEGHGVLESLKSIEFLVVDEADRLLSEGHFKELEEILNALDKQVTNDSDIEASEGSRKSYSGPRQDRQTLVFSATFSKSLQQNLSKRVSLQASDLVQDKSDTMAYLLQKLNFRSGKPTFIDVNPVQQMAENLREGFVECSAGTDKDLYLYTLLLYHHPGARALVFVNSISAAKRLVPFLNNLGLLAYPLQSHMPQKARLRSVERFSALNSTTQQDLGGKEGPSQSKESKILVATDVAARGLDIPNINLVLHYHVPRTADMYVHRSGRTARASNTGSSILLCAPEEVAGVRRLVAQVHAQSTSRSVEEGTSSSKQQDSRKDKSGQRKYYMQALAPDARLVSKLKPRTMLAKKIADSVVVKDKKRKEDEFFRAAAEELGVSSASENLSSDDNFAKSQKSNGSKKGLKMEDKGKGAKKRMESLNVTQDEMKAMKGQLKGLLASKINLGVSEKYFVSQGGERVERLLRERENGAATGRSVRIDGAGVLGTVDGLGWDA